MNDITLPDNFNNKCNCTYTSTSNGGQEIRLSAIDMLKILHELPVFPQIFTMPIQIKEAPILPSNTIFMSSDIAKALEDALKKRKDGNG